jgi:hypothetical protein
MGKFSTTNLHGMTIRESANDGSDFTNPDADYRRLFLGEDGELHTKDSAGNVAGFAGSGIAATLADAAGDMLVASAADTWAKLTKGAAGAVLAMSNGAVAWNAGTSFPGSPATGDRYWRSDIRGGLGFVYDGARWVSDLLTTRAHLDNQASNGTLLRLATPSDLALYVERWVVTTLVLTTNDASNYWSTTLVKTVAANTSTTIATVTTQSDSTSTWVRDGGDVDAVLATTDLILGVNFAKASAPGNLYISAQVDYRLIAT